MYSCPSLRERIDYECRNRACSLWWSVPLNTTTEPIVYYRHLLSLQCISHIRQKKKTTNKQKKNRWLTLHVLSLLSFGAELKKNLNHTYKFELKFPLFDIWYYISPLDFFFKKLQIHRGRLWLSLLELQSFKTILPELGNSRGQRGATHPFAVPSDFQLNTSVLGWRVWINQCSSSNSRAIGTSRTTSTTLVLVAQSFKRLTTTRIILHPLVQASRLFADLSNSIDPLSPLGLSPGSLKEAPTFQLVSK